MNKIALLLTGILFLLATNLYAEIGDLKVNGKLGVGTTAGPSSKLHVVYDYAGSVDHAFRFLNPNQGNTNYLYLTVGKSTTGDQSAVFGFTQESANSRAFMGVTGDDVSGGTGLIVKKGGNVGIGTTNPVVSLEVHGDDNGGLGNVVFSDTAANAVGNGGGILFGGLYSGSSYTQWAAIHGEKESSAEGSFDGGMSFRTRTNAAGWAESMRIKSNGYVGIGTTSPRERLDVRSNYSYADTTDRNIVFLGSNDASGPLGLVIGHSAYGSRYHTWLVGTRYGVSGNDIDINGDSSGAGMTVQYHGSVGIGTTSPGYKLDVAGAIRSSSGGFVFPDGTTQTTAAFSVGSSPTFTDVYTNGWFRNNVSLTGLYNQTNGNHIYSESGNYWTMTSAGSSTGGLIFRDQHQSTLRGYVYHDTSGFGLLHSAGGWAVRVNTGSTELFGNVGIGTTSPQSQLSVGGSGSSSYAIYGYSASGSGSAGVHGYNAGGSGSYGVYGFTAGTSGQGVRGEGYTGVYGYTVASAGYGIYCYSGSNANGCGGNRPWYNSSDEKFKENISTIDNALTKVMQLRGVGFNWKDDSAKKHQHGFVAQEAVTVVPEVVGKDMDGNYTMSYGSLVPLLVEAMKEQQIQIDALKAEIQALKGKH